MKQEDQKLAKDLSQKVRECIKDIGYEQKGFHWKNCNIDINLHSQSSDIAMGVTQKIIKTRKLAIKEQCLVML